MRPRLTTPRDHETREDVVTEPAELGDVGREDEQEVGRAGFPERGETLGDLIGRAIQRVGIGRARMLIGEDMRAGRGSR